MVSFVRAQETISAAVAALQIGTETVPLSEACGRVLAERVAPDTDLPAFENSAVDGYAVSFHETADAWQVKGEVTAGNYAPVEIGPRDAALVMTGGMMPDACDTVIPLEDAKGQGGVIRLKEGARFLRGMNVRHRGEDCACGVTALRAGCLLAPRHLSAAAACGCTSVRVMAPLSIGIFSTGDELIDPSRMPVRDQVRASTMPAISAACRALGMKAEEFGLVRDELQEIRLAINGALDRGVDLLCITGGVSVGSRDYVKDALRREGIELRIEGVLVKPGRPLVFGCTRHAGKDVLVFGLPGNPVSALTAYEVFVKEHLLARYGMMPPFRHVKAALSREIGKRDRKRHFIPASFAAGANGCALVTPAEKRSSSMLVQLGRADCLIILEEERTDPKEGETVECLML
ncbi:MAG: gephyrin-like molybdotransferase Glp [Acidobacteriota bacterium]